LLLRLRDSPRSQDEREGMVVIHGESLDGKALTALRAFVTRRNDHISFGHNVEEFRFNTLLIGSHVMDETELVFGRAVLHLRGLKEWMNAPWDGSAPYDLGELLEPSGSGDPSQPERERRQDTDADPADLPHPLEVPVDGATVKFAFERQSHFGRFGRQTRYDAAADVELTEPMPLDRWREEWSRPLVDLLVFATREQVVVERFAAIIDDPRLVEAVHPAVRRAAPDRVWRRHVVEVVRPHVVDVRERGIRPFQHMLLPLAALGRHAPDRIASYFALHRALGRTAAFFFVVLNTRTILQENRLLNLMAFSEGYHRTFHDDPPLPDNLHRELSRRMLEAIEPEHAPSTRRH
jgi:ApeA N-terminal domain 1